VIPRLFDGALEQVTRGLAFAQARHALLAQNVANAETPGYRAKDLTFDEYLQPTIELASAELPPSLKALTPTGRQPRVVAVADPPVRQDGNTVHVDRQMARLAENTLYQNTLVQILTKQFNTLKLAISGRV
jgi:flagellar basal-body rod protein FlgB